MAKTNGWTRRGALSRPQPLAAYIAVLMLIVLVPGFLFTAILLQRNNQAQEAVVRSLTAATTQAIAASVYRELDGMATTLRVLSTSQALRRGDLAGFHDDASIALADQGAYLLVMDSSYQQLINTRVPFGSVLGATADPNSAARAMATNQATVSDVFFGVTAQNWVFNVLLQLPEGLEAGRLLALTRDASALAERLTSREMPEGWSVALVDGTRKVIASNGGTLPTASQFPLLVPDAAEPGGWFSASIDGVESVWIDWPVSAAGRTALGVEWRVAAWAPAALVSKPLADAFWSLAVGGLLLAGVVLLGALWVIRRIDNSVRSIATEARLLGEGKPIPVRSYPIAEIDTVSTAIARAAAQRTAADAEVRFLMRELAHRSKNQMTVISSMARQTAKSSAGLDDFVADFEKRIAGLARSTDLLMAHGAAGVDLGELVNHQLESFRPGDGERVVVAGPPVRLNAQAAQTLGMAMHELATNAAKYGAFRGDGGTLSVRWRTEGGLLDFTWRETVASLPGGDGRKGFGTSVLQTMVKAALGAKVVRTLHADGIEWHFEIPLDRLDPRQDMEEPEAG